MKKYINKNYTFQAHKAENQKVSYESHNSYTGKPSVELFIGTMSPGPRYYLRSKRTEFIRKTTLPRVWPSENLAESKPDQR